jgi:hypothetical protein
MGKYNYSGRLITHRNKDVDIIPALKQQVAVNQDFILYYWPNIRYSARDRICVLPDEKLFLAGSIEKTGNNILYIGHHHFLYLYRVCGPVIY